MRTVFLALTLVAPLAFAQTPIDKTMVVVNGQPITAKNYFKRMEVLPGTGQLVNEKFVSATPGYLTLSKIIDETLMIQLAKDKGVAPTDTEIENVIKERLAESPDLEKGLARIGFTLDDLRYDTRVQLSEYKVQTMGINITDMEAEAFYTKNKTLYTMPKRYLLRVIAVDGDDKKRAVDDALNSGKSFSDVAKELSLDISKGEGGKMGEVPEAALTGETLRGVKSTKKGGITDWLSNGQVSVKFLIEDVMDEKLVPYDATLKAAIRRNLMLDRGRVKNDVAKMMANMRAKAKIELQGTMFDDQIKSGFGKG